jgi:hypothetical protein
MQATAQSERVSFDDASTMLTNTAEAGPGKNARGSIPPELVGALNAGASAYFFGVPFQDRGIPESALHD